MNNDIKVVITTVPFVDWSTPLVTPAYLKAILKKKDIDCVGIDLNIEIYNKIKNDPDRDLYLDFFYKQKIHNKIATKLTAMFYHYVKRILQYKPTHLACSLFSKDSQVFTVWLTYLLKKIQPNLKILIGGPGLETLSKRQISFPDSLLNKKYIDAYIVGDSSKSFINYFLNTESNTAINVLTPKKDEDFTLGITPDFDDYNFLDYEHVRLSIVDSRGCVQKCEFCDVIEFWKHYQYLPAEKIFSQMLTMIERYNVYRFDFTSSISNGNMVEFTKLMQMIADFNHNKKINKQIHWNGNFIIRKKGRHTDELYQNIKKSNGHLNCGVESLISQVRINLGKNFTNEDLDYHLLKCKQFNIPINLLIIAAYPTESTADYDKALKWFENNKNYANNTIMEVQMTLPALLAGTRLEKKINKQEFDKGYIARKKHGDNLKQKALECGFQVVTFF